MSSNGKHPTRGKKLTPWTVPSTGVVVQTIPVSYIAITDAMLRESAWAEPEPPLVEVNIAGHTQYERNYADPDYPAALQRWEGRFNAEAMRRLLYRIAAAQVLTDDQQAEVTDLREVLTDEGLHKSDKVVWLLECALGDDKDYQALVEFVTDRADPKEKNIEKKAEGSD